ncbi:nucleoporin NUP35 [Bacillus rossius redtenbacheri]|uniref:nucleoporin NUP35 n=1 Tax=Bacillus rossius redtenbacheri TaxID=93214 RepID=UPI002FDED8A0
MEAMTLGSPVSSPGSLLGPTGLTSPFLPGFLIGDTSAQSPAHTPIFASSPSKAGKHVTFGETPVMARTPTLATEPRQPLLQRMPTALQTPEKSGGPPTQALFDTLTSPMTPSSFTGASDSFAQMSSPLSQTETWDNNWVTVFGFPANTTQAVIQHFSHFGTIVDRRLPNQGNWVHLRYQGRLECHKALANNGRVLLGRVMIGVLPCKDKTIVGENTGVCTMPGTPGTPDSVMSPRQLTIGSPSVSVSSPLSARTARPLVQAYKIAQADSRVVSPANMPQKSTGVVSRAMEYLFL